MYSRKEVRPRIELSRAQPLVDWFSRMRPFKSFTWSKFWRIKEFRKLQYLFQVFALLSVNQLPRENEGLLAMNRVKTI